MSNRYDRCLYPGCNRPNVGFHFLCAGHNEDDDQLMDIQSARGRLYDRLDQEDDHYRNRWY